MTQTDVAVVDPSTAPAPAETKEPLDPDWPYERFEYRGDNLAIRLAPMQALMAYQMSAGKYVSPERQNDMSGLYVDHYLGPDSYDRIMERMVDADDPDYDMSSFGEIMGEQVRRSIAKIREDRKAKELAEKAVPA